MKFRWQKHVQSVIPKQPLHQRVVLFIFVCDLEFLIRVPRCIVHFSSIQFQQLFPFNPNHAFIVCNLKDIDEVHKILTVQPGIYKGMAVDSQMSFR